jgi:AcrR family transcriptional regulator
MRQPARRAATRTAIVEAASGLFAERGFEGTTIDDIVAAADVARGSFYYNFKSKEEVVLAIGRRDFARVVKSLDRKLARGVSPSVLLRELMLSACRWYTRHPHLAKTMLFASFEQAANATAAAMASASDRLESPSFRKLAERILAAGQEAGEIRTDFEAKALAETATGLLLQAALYWVLAPRPGRLDHCVDRSLTVFLEGAQSRETD